MNHHITGSFIHSHTSFPTRPYATPHTTDTQDIARGVHSRLLAAVPGLHLVRGVTLDRFLHHDLVEHLEGQEEVKAGETAEAAQ